MVVLALPLSEASDIASRLKLPFVVLADEDGSTTRRMVGDSTRAAMCVADRYGSAVYVERRASLAELSGARTALDWLDFIQMQCPE
jgi:hypothetical protein